ncbi:hypothetical protein COO60DRAFT_1628329 [Scenedesmus sp. NREL 46B-D3]|nr:hypothetical protein COO60DRAFT_1628329 [Scenedesmus sp. NREL 46B-D3]
MSDELDEYAVLEEFEHSQGLQQQADAGGKRKHEGGGDAEYVSPPMCSCGAGTCIMENDQQGRQFFVCPEEEGGQCSFRLAVDAMKQSRTAAAAAAARWPNAQQYGQLGQGQYDTPAPGQYNNQQQQGQHGDSSQQQGPGEGGPPPPNCECGGAASMRTSNSARNPGRQFFSCGKPMGDESRCNFFKWVDALAAGGGGSQAGGGAAAGWAGRPAASQPQGAAADGGPSCDCGGLTVLRTSQSARNPGRQFYACAKSMNDESRCKFFQWADAAPAAGGGGGGGGGYGYGGGATAAGGGGGFGFGAAPGYGAAAAGGAVATDGAAAGGTGGTGRFAWEDGTAPPAGAGGAAGSYGGGGGSCFKCGQSGHWARDCPSAAAGGGAGGAGGGVCYKCNQPAAAVVLRGSKKGNAPLP